MKKYTKEQIIKLGEEFKDLKPEEREEYISKVKRLNEIGYSVPRITEIAGMSEQAVRMILGEGI